MTETRAAIVYARAVKRLSKNDEEVPLPKIAVQKQSFQQLLWISGTRPLGEYNPPCSGHLSQTFPVLLFSEPIIFAISVRPSYPRVSLSALMNTDLVRDRSGLHLHGASSIA
jgi:hypothetical protein